MEEKDKSADNVMDDLMNLSLEKIHENAEKQGYSATHAKLESPSKNDHETSLPGELEFDNFEESLGLDEEHQRKADAEKQGDPARDATLESSSTNEDETSLPDNAKLDSFSLELDDKHHRKADREKQEGSISIFSEDNREFSFQTDKVNAESKIKKISGTISKNQIPENKTRLELPESNESSTLDIAIQKKSKVTPVYKTVGKEIDISNVEMDPIKKSRGRPTGTKTKKVGGAPIDLKFEPYHKLNRVKQATVLLMLLKNSKETVQNCKEGCYTLTLEDIAYISANNLPDIFVQSSVDISILQNYLEPDAFSKLKSMRDKRRKMKKNIFICNVCRLEAHDEVGECTCCGGWVHYKCVNMSQRDFDSVDKWFCPSCVQCF